MKKIKHWPGKTIFESDNNLFSLITMNHHPVHLDINYAKKQKHKKRDPLRGLIFYNLAPCYFPTKTQYSNRYEA